MRKGKKSLNHTYLYIISHHHDDGPVKVGITTSVPNRLKSLQTGNPSKLYEKFSYPVGSRGLARDMESTFMRVNCDEYGMCGEWYNMTVSEAKRRLKPIIFDALVFKKNFSLEDAEQIINSMNLEEGRG